MEPHLLLQLFHLAMVAFAHDILNIGDECPIFKDPCKRLMILGRRNYMSPPHLPRTLHNPQRVITEIHPTRKRMQVVIDTTVPAHLLLGQLIRIRTEPPHTPTDRVPIKGHRYFPRPLILLVPPLVLILNISQQDVRRLHSISVASMKAHRRMLVEHLDDSHNHHRERVRQLHILHPG